MSEMPSAGDRCQPLACGLSPDGLRERKVLIDELLARGLTRLTAIPDGLQARFVAHSGLKADLDALAELEARCCAFLTLTVAEADDAIVLEVTGAPETQGLIAELFAERAPHARVVHQGLRGTPEAAFMTKSRTGVGVSGSRLA